MRIPNTVFFESIIYREIFPKLRTEWETLDFVITGIQIRRYYTYIHTYIHIYIYTAVDLTYLGTYKTVAKQLHYNGFTQNQAQIKFFLDVAKNGQYDVVPFLRRLLFFHMCLCMYVLRDILCFKITFQWLRYNELLHVLARQTF